MAAGECRIEEALNFPIVLSGRIRQAVNIAVTFKFECSEVGKQADRITQMLHSTVRLTTSTNSLYETPVRRIAAEVSNNLGRALALVHKCKSRGIVHRIITIVTVADFRLVLTLLEASVGDMRWLLSLFDGAGGIILSLPPIASTDPILSWVWSFIASIHMGQLNDKIEAVLELASVAKDSDRNKKIIVQEGGIPPLIMVLKECTLPEAQIAAANALCILANDQDRVRIIANEFGVPIIVQVLVNSPMRVQVSVANLMARMAEFDYVVKEDFARENAIRPLVTLVSPEMNVDDPNKGVVGKQSIHSIVQINKQMEGKSFDRLGSFYWLSQARRDREIETPEAMLKLKISCSGALRMLARGSVSNSMRITETKGLLCLARHIEREDGELKINCLMAIMEITAAAESNAELRRAAFKTNSAAAKAVVDQLVKLISDSSNPSLQIPAIRSIGSLARTFAARQIWVVDPIVEQLGSQHQEVSTEAAIALGKFACPDNFLHAEHTKTIIECNGLFSLLRLLRGNETVKYHGVVLLCYLALYVSDKEVSDHGLILTALEDTGHSLVSEHPELKELVSNAISHLNVYHAGGLSHRQPYTS